jgi:hypothetical protein
MSQRQTNNLASLLAETLLLRCKDCHCQFEFSGEEQSFFRSRDFPAPIRCPACRRARKRAMRQRQAG